MATRANTLTLGSRCIYCCFFFSTHSYVISMSNCRTLLSWGICGLNWMPQGNVRFNQRVARALMNDAVIMRHTIFDVWFVSVIYWTVIDTPIFRFNEHAVHSINQIFTWMMWSMETCICSNVTCHKCLTCRRKSWKSTFRLFPSAPIDFQPLDIADRRDRLT